MRTFKLLIGGALVDGALTMSVVNPATGLPFQSCPRADASQLEHAVAAAKAAFRHWSRTTLDDRSGRLYALADALERRADEFAALLTCEQGKPLAQAAREIAGAVGALRAFAAMDLPTVVLREDATARVVQHRLPLGVVAAITPWNFPMALLMNKLAPALLAGNTVVVKPAPTTPLTTLLLGELCADLLPPGVVNVTTDENDLGSTLTGHPDVAKVTFTGSTATGRKVMASAAGGIKRLTLELGGNDAALVLDDAPARETARKVFEGAMYNAGQICVAVKRVYVNDAMIDEFCDELARCAREAVVGDGMRPGTQLGPVQNRVQFDKLQELLADVRRTGTVVAGGSQLDGPGFFIAPTIVRDVTDDSRVVREEQFGPVLPVLRYADLDDAIERINDSPYGLGGTVWGRDVRRAQAVAMRIQSGTVWVNKSMEISPLVPFRGMKQSGFGTELGREGLEEFTQARVLNVALV